MDVKAFDKTGKEIQVGDAFAYQKSERGSSPETMFAVVREIVEGKRPDGSVGPLLNVWAYEADNLGGDEEYLARSRRKILYPERYIVIDHETLKRYFRRYRQDDNDQ